MLRKTALRKSVPEMFARPWPARFIAHSHEESKEQDYHAFYLVGLRNIPGPKDNELDPSRRDAIHATCAAFIDRIRTDDQFDGTSTWIDVLIVNKSQLGLTQLDAQNWGFPAEQEATADKNIDDEEAAYASSMPNSQISTVNKLKSTTVEPTPTPTGKKLRPASGESLDPPSSLQPSLPHISSPTIHQTSYHASSTTLPTTRRTILSATSTASSALKSSL
jgi:hypothetical protein